MGPLLTVRNLRALLPGEAGLAAAVDGVDLTLDEGEVLGLVGESGCGKTMMALSLMRLLPGRGARLEGEIVLGGTDLQRLPERAMRGVRGKRMAMIFQEPMTALNPVLTLGRQIAESVRQHEGVSAAQARARALEMLLLVQMPDAERRLTEYPHELSGGMRQRGMIAVALACRPHVLIADEPTTALDVTVQAQILALLAELRARLGMALLLITHDLGVVAEQCDRVVVMYAGRVAEQAPVRALFARPRHPYTRGLMGAVPHLTAEPETRLTEIPGIVPSLSDMPTGCRFAPRCTRTTTACRVQPPLLPAGNGHLVACWHPHGRDGDA
jgi:peptide/nickel transport system ATP-binding protein